MAAATAAWPVSGATLRFELEVKKPPAESCAGVLVILPDGGLMPKPHVAATVLDGKDKPLRSEIVWHNRDEGLGVVFEPPAGDRAWVYLAPGSAAPGRATGTPFCAGLFLYAAVTRADLNAAEDLARQNPPGRDARFGLRRFIGDRENPLGPDDNYVSYYRGYLNLKKGGEYFFCTISDEGSLFRIDGKKVAAWPGAHTRQGGAKGEYGEVLELPAGRHLVEYFQFELEGPQEMHLAWREPGSKAGSLPKTVPDEAYTHSGTAQPVSLETADGRPAAAFLARPETYFWLGERPITLYKAKPLLARNVPDEVCIWSWPGVAGVQTNDLWFVKPGNQPVPLTLTVRRGQESFSCTYPILEETAPKAAKVENAADRRDYRVALLQRCLGVPRNERPCADWNEDLWDTLFEIIEPFAGSQLFDEIFGRSRADVMKLPEARRWRLEDLYVENLRLGAPARLPEWIDRLRREETDRARILHWELYRAEHTLYDLGDPPKAAQGLKDLGAMAAAAGPEGQGRLLVRQADIERIRGDLEAARKLYQQAAELRARVSRRAAVPAPAPGPPGAPAVPAGPAGTRDWRAGAVRSAVYYDTVRTYLLNHEWEAARKALEDWEVDFPLAKLQGAYPLAEARYYKGIRDFNRAARILRAYRKSVEITNELPPAMATELECWSELGRREDLDELIKDIRKRLPTHPVAQQAETYARRTGGKAAAKMVEEQ